MRLRIGNYALGCVSIIDLCNALEITPTELLSDFIKVPKQQLKEAKIDKLSERDCNIILTMIDMMQN